MARSFLEREPIYCIEQVKIPSGLATMLKTFAKEAIRAQPANLEEFALLYFQNLLKMIKLNVCAPPPSMEQLIEMYQQTKYLEYINQKPLGDIARRVKIHDAAIENVFKLANFPSDLVDPKEFILLLLTCTAKSFGAVFRGMFKLFGARTGEKIPVTLLFICINHLAKRDNKIDLELFAQLEDDLKTRDVKEVVWEDIETNPIMFNYLKYVKEKSLVS